MVLLVVLLSGFLFSFVIHELLDFLNLLQNFFFVISSVLDQLSLFLDLLLFFLEIIFLLRLLLFLFLFFLWFLFFVLLGLLFVLLGTPMLVMQPVVQMILVVLLQLHSRGALLIEKQSNRSNGNDPLGIHFLIIIYMRVQSYSI